MLFAVTLALAPGPHPPPLRRGTLTRRAVLLPTLATGSAALLAAAAAKPASAAYGPAGAAVFSVPDLIKINVEEWLALPAEKALQRIGSISEVGTSPLCQRLILVCPFTTATRPRRHLHAPAVPFTTQGRVRSVAEQLEEIIADQHGHRCPSSALLAGRTWRLWAALHSRQRRVRPASATEILATASTTRASHPPKRQFHCVLTTQADQSLETLGEMKRRLASEANDYNSSATYDELQSLELRFELQTNRRKSAIALARQLREREQLLAGLKAQPLPIVYGAAALASVGSTLVMHPVDTFKTLQITAANGAGAEAKAAAVKPSKRKSSSEPPLGKLPFALPPLQELYVGLLPNLVKEAPSSALYLGIYELVRSGLMAPGAPFESAPLLAYLVAGAAGEFVGSVIRAPAEATKCRVQSGLASSAAEAFGQVLDKPSQLLTAWSSSLWRDVPMGAVQIAVFELAKAYCINSPEFGANVNTLPAEAAFGALGGLVGAVLTTPADVVTTRIITASEAEGEAVEADGGGEAGPLEVALSILQESGPSGFFVGVGSRAFYWAPAIGIFLSLYCSLRQTAFNLGL